jgi:hypothetical protein
MKKGRSFEAHLASFARSNKSGTRVLARYADGFTARHLQWTLLGGEDGVEVQARWFNPTSGSENKASLRLQLDLLGGQSLLAALSHLEPEYTGSCEDAETCFLAIKRNNDLWSCSVYGAELLRSEHPELAAFFSVWEPIVAAVESALRAHAEEQTRTDSREPAFMLAHRHSSNHREELLASQKCGCFYCRKTFAPSAVVEWIENGATALCPSCGIDSVIGDASLYPIDPDFLKAMADHWFAQLSEQRRKTSSAPPTAE